MLTLLLRNHRFSSNRLRNLITSTVFVTAIAIPWATPLSGAQSLPQWQVAAGGHSSFDVVSIHPAAPGVRWHSNVDLDIEDSAVPPGGIFSATARLDRLIEFAYRLMLVGQQHDAVFAHLPKWVSSDFFVIEAKTSMANVSKDQMRLMVQSLLADRFKLALHFEMHDARVIALVQVEPGRLGPHLRPHSLGSPCDAKISPVDPNSPKIPDDWPPVCGVTQAIDWANHTVILGSRDTTLDAFAAYIPTLIPLDRPVVDRSQLTGRFDYQLNFTPESRRPQVSDTDTDLDLTGPNFLEALKEQLGLKLISTHATVRSLVIEHVEPPSPN